MQLFPLGRCWPVRPWCRLPLSPCISCAEFDAQAAYSPHRVFPLVRTVAAIFGSTISSVLLSLHAQTITAATSLTGAATAPARGRPNQPGEREARPHERNGVPERHRPRTSGRSNAGPRPKPGGGERPVALVQRREPGGGAGRRGGAAKRGRRNRPRRRRGRARPAPQGPNRQPGAGAGRRAPHRSRVAGPATGESVSAGQPNPAHRHPGQLERRSAERRGPDAYPPAGHSARNRAPHRPPPSAQGQCHGAASRPRYRPPARRYPGGAAGACHPGGHRAARGALLCEGAGHLAAPPRHSGQCHGPRAGFRDPRPAPQPHPPRLAPRAGGADAPRAGRRSGPARAHALGAELPRR